MNRYDPEHRCITSTNESVLLNINRETIMAIMNIPLKEPYVNWTITSSYGFFFEKKAQYRSAFARNWLMKFQKGGSRLPKLIMRKYLMKEVRDTVILLHIVKGSQHAFF